MEDQGKRLLLAVAVAFAIMMIWTFLFPSEKPPESERKGEDGRTPAADVTSTGAARAGAAGGASPGAPTGAPTATVRGPEQSFVLESDQIRAEFSSWGGVLKSWQLRGDQFHIPGEPGMTEDLVRLADPEHRPFTVSFSDGSTHAIPAQAEWRGEKKSDRELVFTWQSDQLLVAKRFVLHPEDYLVDLDVTVEAVGGTAKQGLIVSLFSQQDPKTRQEAGWTTQGREWKVACYVDGELGEWEATAVADRAKEERGDVGWGGFVHSFFVFAMAPLDTTSSLGCRAYGVQTAPGGMGIDIIYPLAPIEAGKAGRLVTRMVTYLGPKYLEKLEGIAAKVGESPGFEKAVDLGFWGFIAGPMLWLLEAFHSMSGSWGIAIILLTVVVKLATLYWTHKSMKSMKEMAKLRPQLDKLREKYKDDRQKQQVETMNLFKAHGVNPVAGCLPMLLQMPIWFALYRALSVAGELYQAPFLWITDLTAPDPYFILPVFMTGAMLLQSRMTPTTGTGMQQKMLLYGMPLMFGVMGFFFPAGLSLYISTNTTLTLFHHLYMRRNSDSEPSAGAAKTQAGVEVVEMDAVATESDSGDGVDATGSPKGGAEAVRNGQRPPGTARGNQPGRHGGRRRRSSRSS